MLPDINMLCFVVGLCLRYWKGSKTEHGVSSSTFSRLQRNTGVYSSTGVFMLVSTTELLYI